jgi:hypothetical protein
MNNKGIGTNSKSKCIGIKFHPIVEEILRDMPDKCEYIRELVRKDLVAKGIIPEFF